MSEDSQEVTDNAEPVGPIPGLISHSGDSLVWLGMMVLVAVLSDGYWRNWALTILAALLIVGLVVKIMKAIWRKQRPAGELGAIYRKTDPYAFPSGHAARAALLLTMAVAMGPVWLVVVFLFWAPLVCWSRIRLRLHVAFEVIVGFIVGALGGLVIAILNRPLPVDFQSLF